VKSHLETVAPPVFRHALARGWIKFPVTSQALSTVALNQPEESSTNQLRVAAHTSDPSIVGGREKTCIETVASKVFRNALARGWIKFPAPAPERPKQRRPRKPTTARALMTVALSLPEEFSFHQLWVAAHTSDPSITRPIVSSWLTGRRATLDILVVSLRDTGRTMHRGRLQQFYRCSAEFAALANLPPPTPK